VRAIHRPWDRLLVEPIRMAGARWFCWLREAARALGPGAVGVYDLLRACMPVERIGASE